MAEDPGQGMEEQEAAAADQQEQDLTVADEQADDVKGGGGLGRPPAAPVYEDEG